MTSTCAFTVCDEKYAPQAVVALTAARKWSPNIQLFVLSDQLSDSSREFFQRYEIAPVVDPLPDYFNGVPSPYPRQCFFWFAAAALLSSYGTERALYLDADTLTNGPIEQILQNEALIVGSAAGPITSILHDDREKLEASFGALSGANRIQSGVLALQLTALNEFGLLAKVQDLFEQCVRIGAPRRGDDGLLALLQSVYPGLPTATFDPCFNIIERQGFETHSEAWHREGEDGLSQPAIFHFTSRSEKPWNAPVEFPTYRAKYFTKKWERHAVDTLSQADLSRYFPSVSNKLTTKHLRFYSYPAVNVGDNITPYLTSIRPRTDGISRPTSRKPLDEETISKIEQKYSDRLSGPVGRLRTRLAPGARKSLVGRFADYAISCGSVVRLCGDHALVFGSGARSSFQDVGQALIRFVRGPLTREIFLLHGVECPAVFGDPGLVLPRLYHPEVRPRYDLGIIPHFGEVELVRQEWNITGSMRIIDPNTADVEGFISALLECRKTVSSSLHGLILSHAYRVPTRHMLVSDTIHGDGTKFEDHYSAIGIPHHPVDLRSVSPTNAQLLELPNEQMGDFDDRWLWDEMFVDQDGMKRSAMLPY